MAKKAVCEETLELLPWFVNESLGEREHAKVIAHLRECQPCRHERDQLQEMQQVVLEDGEPGADYRFAFRKLMQRIEAAEANRASTRDFEVRSEWRGMLPWFGVAASLLLAVVFVAGITETPANDTVPAGEEFRTLTATSDESTGITHRVALTFEVPIKAETLRSALIETRSNIVSGPDDDGTYILEVAVPGEMSDHEFIESMREIRGVQYAAFETSATDLPR